MTRTEQLRRNREWTKDRERVLASERRLAASQNARWGQVVDLVDALAGSAWAKPNLTDGREPFQQVRDLVNALCGRSAGWLARQKKET